MLVGKLNNCLGKTKERIMRNSEDSRRDVRLGREQS